MSGLGAGQIHTQWNCFDHKLLKAFLAQLSAHNPALKAIVALDEEGARRRARLADGALAGGIIWGPLHSVPVTVKDVFEKAGMRTTSSHKALANYVPEQDATVVARPLYAGAILLGKSNLPEFAAGFGEGRTPGSFHRA